MLHISQVYAPGTTLKLYQAATVPGLPRIVFPDTWGARWHRVSITNAERKKIRETDPLQLCYDHDVAYESNSLPTAITLAAPLATGIREERPVQVWTARREDSPDLLVARIYDPLYYNILWLNRFEVIERAVAIENECYSRLKPFAGKLAPQYFGVFVAEIPAPERPRHVYVILLGHIAGSDVRQLMDDAAERTCAEHKTSIIDAAARVLYQFFRVGVSPTDLKDSNTILQLPRTSSNEEFCISPACPFRHLVHIDFTFDVSCPQSSGHAYSPRAFIIDLEKAVFYSEDSPIVAQADIQHCRVRTIQQWLINDCLRWMEPAVICAVLAPYGMKPYLSSPTTLESSESSGMTKQQTTSAPSLAKQMIPAIKSVYYKPIVAGLVGATFELYAPSKIPDLPPAQIERVKDRFTPEKVAEKQLDPNAIVRFSWPSTLLDENERREMSQPEVALAKCYENDAPYQGASLITISLETPLAAGAREERPAQVWKVNATGSNTPLVARIYDPLYFDTAVHDRFKTIQLAVASEHEAYTRLKKHQGTLVPRFHGVFVAEIPGVRPRHVNVVLLEYIPGVDLQAKMRTVEDATCIQHKFGIFNAVARASSPLYQCGVHPDDLMDRNVLLQEPREPSLEAFCSTDGCPFRHTLHIDLGDSLTDDHLYAPRLFIIDLEHVRFGPWKYDLPKCRNSIVRTWEACTSWLLFSNIRAHFGIT
ncbi:hypothetical protein B0H12DRAFT_544674 [Mycena haematopus]|nr:hypothetical protein B0H12DRAFT_544674 [Mycena haematopus]